MSDVDRIEQMVAEGRITQEEADQLIAVLREVDAAGERLEAAGSGSRYQGDAAGDDFDAEFEAEYLSAYEAAVADAGAQQGPALGTVPSPDEGPRQASDTGGTRGDTRADGQSADTRTYAEADPQATSSQPQAQGGQPAPPAQPARPDAPEEPAQTHRPAEPHRPMPPHQPSPHGAEADAAEAVRAAQRAAREAARSAAREARDVAREAMRAARDAAKEASREAARAGKEAARMAAREAARQAAYESVRGGQSAGHPGTGAPAGKHPSGMPAGPAALHGRRSIAPAGTRWVEVEMLGGELSVIGVQGLQRPTAQGTSVNLEIEETADGFRVVFMPDRSGLVDRILTSIRAGTLKLQVPAGFGLDLKAAAGDVELRGVDYLTGRMRAGELEADRLYGVDFSMTAGEFNAELDIRGGDHQVSIGAGDLEVTLPETADVTVHGKVSIGDPTSFLPSVSRHGSGLGGVLEGVVGAGTGRLELRVATGDIDVRPSRRR